MSWREAGLWRKVKDNINVFCPTKLWTRISFNDISLLHFWALIIESYEGCSKNAAMYVIKQNVFWLEVSCLGFLKVISSSMYTLIPALFPLVETVLLSFFPYVFQLLPGICLNLKNHIKRLEGGWTVIECWAKSSRVLSFLAFCEGWRLLDVSGLECSGPRSLRSLVGSTFGKQRSYHQRKLPESRASWIWDVLSTHWWHIFYHPLNFFTRSFHLFRYDQVLPNKPGRD